MPQLPVSNDAVANRVEVHLLDVGATRYGDCVLCRFGGLEVLIDGAHPGDYVGKAGHNSIPDQLAEILDQQADALTVDLLLITHTHSDHFGCLPRLINGGQLSAQYAIVADPDMGWGRNGANSDAHPDPRVRQALEILRDDQGFAAAGGADAMQFFADAASQEDTYRAMVKKLGETGKIVTYLGQDPDTKKFDPDLQSILDHFAQAGLKVDLLGPSGVQVAKCAQEIAKTLSGGAGAAEDLIGRGLLADGPLSSYDAFADAAGRAGNYVNLQSLVTLFTYGGRKFMFSGDMQLEDQRATKTAPPVSEVIATEVTALKDAIRANGPYDFVKIGHHGSYNSFSEEILADYGEETVIFGISTGEVSPTHPDPKVTIPILKKNTNRIQWARTDYNRHFSFTFSGPAVTYELETGKINDTRLNKADLGKPDEGAQAAPQVAPKMIPAAVPHTPPPTPILAPPVAAVRNSITIQVPLAVTVTVGIGDQPDASHSATEVKPPLPPGRPSSRTSLPDLTIGNGRDFSKLLFVSSRKGLADNIGETEANQVLSALRSYAKVLDDLPGGLADPRSSIAAVQTALRADPSIQGVVIVGGHDVIPHQIFDCLPPNVRAGVDVSADEDRFIVWNDAPYGRRLDNSLQDVPVSRIPDGHLSELMFAAVQARKSSFPRAWIGLRNKLRPFAATIFKQVSTDPMLTSAEVLYTDFPPPEGTPYDVHSENVYLMLHGDYTKSDFFWGERTLGNYTNAFAVSKIPAHCGQVVFTGCCWGALTTTLRACDAVPGRPIGSKEPATSIALTFLQNGALAFVGCTGTHYSPAPNQPVSAGGAMHDGFFRHLGTAKAEGGTVGPAEALFLAKQDYLKNMPHGLQDRLSVAIEYKILHEYTCLGLGW